MTTYARLNHHVVIGIGGGTGSGKSCLSNCLLRKYKDIGISLIDQDSYYIDRSDLGSEERQKVNYDHPASIDHELIFRHVKALTRGLPIEKPCYCFATHTRTKEATQIDPAPILLVEGIFALWDMRLRALMDLKVYVEAESDLRFIRRLRRDVLERGRTVESVVTQYLESVRPMHESYIAHTKLWADVVLYNNGLEEEFERAAEGLTAKIPRLATSHYAAKSGINAGIHPC